MSEFAFQVNYNAASDNTFEIEHNLASSGVRVTLDNNKVFTVEGAYKVYQVQIVNENKVSITMFADMFNTGAVDGKVVTF